ncbi:MAG: type IV toxin-antitoxin system AbiEi family antitoxin domain-containing protein [Marmoricola sp.]
MLSAYIDPGQVLLDARFPLPLSAPFTLTEARRAGLHPTQVSGLCEAGILRRLLHGVYVVAQIPDSLELRSAALRLVVPSDAVVTDRTAGWLHGAPMVLAPNDHLATPPVSVFLNRKGARLRNGLARSGQRLLRDEDVVEINGVLVTTPVRTACDLGRLLHRDSALAALDAMLRLGRFDSDELWDSIGHLKGMRGVRQLRALAPLADPRAESMGESVLRLRWLDIPSLPRPELQIPVARPGRWPYRVDLGVEELLMGFEYDGEEWHRRTARQIERDRGRRAWLRDERDWLICPVTKVNVFGAHRDVEDLLHAGFAEALRRQRRIR